MGGEKILDQSQNTTEWTEPLPENCPPEDSIIPNNEAFYRMVETIPPTEADFYSLGKRSPKKINDNNRCRILSCSLFSKYISCTNRMEGSTHSHKFIVKIILPPESGRIKQTGIDRTHYSWWIKKDFKPEEHCEVVA